MEFEALSTDNTALFRARIKMLRMKQPQQRRPSVAESIGEATVLLSVNSERFKVYAAQSRNICAHIRELKDLIMDKRKSYLLSTVNAYGHDNLMSDSDRKQCDEQMEVAMKQCSHLVRNLEAQLDEDTDLRRQDEFPHLKAVTFLLNIYLQNVCKIVAELRASQLKKTEHLSKICRLGNMVHKYKNQIDRIQKENKDKKMEVQRKREALDRRIAREKEGLSVKEEDNGWEEEKGWEFDEDLEIKEEKKEKLAVDEQFGVRQRNTNVITSADDEFHEANEEQQQVIPQPMQARLLKENNRMYEKFSQRSNEIELIEAQFAEVQKLQQTFAEKVVEQERDIEIIHEKTIYTLENMDQANEFITKAIKNSASRRVIALFCLIVLTMVLLFIDWYNP